MHILLKNIGVLYFLMLLCSTAAFAQELNIVHYTENQKLINSGITSMGFENHSNQIWIGTRQQGIYIYKNQKFSRYNLEHQKSHIHGLTFVNDEKHNLWYVNPNKGVCVGKVVEGQIPQNSLINLPELGYLPERVYFNILYSGNSPRLFFTGFEVAGYDDLTTRKRVFTSLLPNTVIEFSEVMNNTLYCASNIGLLRLDSNGRTEIIYPKPIKSLCLDRQKKCVWILETDYLKLFDLQTKKSIAQYPLPESFRQSVSEMKSCAHEKGILFYNRFAIFNFDYSTHQFVLFTKQYGLATNGAKLITQDKENNLWIGHLLGISKISNLYFSSYTGSNLKIKEEEVSVIKKLNNGDFLLGGNTSLVRTDASLNPINNFDLSPLNSNLPHLLDAAQTSDHSILFTYFSGLGMLKDNKISVVNNLHGSGYLGLYADDKNIFAGCMSGLYAMDIKQFRSTNTRLHSVRKIFKKNDSTLILCSEECASEWSLIHHRLIKKIINKSCYSYAQNSDKTIEYFGTLDGLYEKKGDQLNKIPIDRNKQFYVFALCNDINNNLWVGTNTGLFLYQTSEKQFTKLNLVYNIKGLEVNRSALYTDSQYAYIGTNAGLNKIPINFKFCKYLPPVLISEIKTNKAKYTTLIKNKFDYAENSFTFTFCLNSYVNEYENSFSYLLEGYDKDWSFSKNQFDVRYTNLAPGKYTFRVKGRNVFGTEAKEAFFSFTIQPPWWRTWYFYGFMGILTYIVIYYFFRWRLQSLKKKLQDRQQLVESELKALRSQINPHYLSNSLLSLQNLVLDEKKQEAFEVIGQYGKVMRNILYNSENSFIPLLKEIEVLDQYLKLENTLSAGEYEFTLDYPALDDTLLEQIQIPPMLIQPFIENALIHGLARQQENPKKLLIRFTFDKKLVCVIEDNGIGRLAQKPVKSTKSMGIKNVQDRFELYGKLLKMETHIEFVDLTENNKPKGTRVILTLPFKLITDTNI